MHQRIHRRAAVVRVAAGHVDFRREHALRCVARVNLRQLDEAPRQQRRGHEQQHGKGGLGHQQPFAQAPRPPAAEPAGARAVAAVQRLGQIEAGAAQRRRQAREDRRDEHCRGGEGDRGAVEADGVEARKIARHDGRRDAHDRPREPEPEGAADRRQHRALGQELPREAPAARADGRPHRQLALPRQAARQKQVRDIRAGNQQQADDGAGEYQQGGTHARGHLVDHAADVDDRRTADAEEQVRRHRADRRADRRRALGFGLRQRCARAQPRDSEHDADESALAGHDAGFLAPHGERRPHQRVGGRKGKARPRHPDDRVWLIVDRDPASDDRRIAVEALAPSAMAEDHDCRMAGGAFVGREEAAECGRFPEQRQQRRRQLRADEPRRFAVERDGVLIGSVARELFDRPRRIGPGVIGQVAEHRRPQRGVRAGMLFRHADEPFSRRIRKGPQQDAVDDRKDRAGRADPERERQQPGCSEALASAHHRQRVARVLPERLHRERLYSHDGGSQ